jgi:hypothetical protein
MKMLMMGTAALFVMVGFGAASAAQPSRPSYATSLPACVSKSSPILDLHYGYDDRRCSQELIEGRAAAEGDASRLSAETHYATSLPPCVSAASPILDPHYGYDDRACGQAADYRGG